MTQDDRDGSADNIANAVNDAGARSQPESGGGSGSRFTRRSMLKGAGVAGIGLIGLGAIGSSGILGGGNAESSGGGSGSGGEASGTGAGAADATQQTAAQQPTARSTANKYAYRSNGIGIVDDYQMLTNDNQFMGPSTVGTAVNISGTELSYVQIQIAYYDAGNYQLGTGVANTNNLAPDARWRYEVTAFDEFSASEMVDWEWSITAY